MRKLVFGSQSFWQLLAHGPKFNEPFLEDQFWKDEKNVPCSFFLNSLKFYENSVHKIHAVGGCPSAQPNLSHSQGTHRGCPIGSKPKPWSDLGSLEHAPPAWVCGWRHSVPACKPPVVGGARSWAVLGARAETAGNLPSALVCGVCPLGLGVCSELVMMQLPELVVISQHNLHFYLLIYRIASMYILILFRVKVGFHLFKWKIIQ